MIDDINSIQEIAENVFKHLQPYCIAIYLGGSMCEGIIKNVHDIDFIFFSDKPVDMCHIRRLLFFYQQKYNIPESFDFIQVRTKQKEEHDYGSYINKKMIKLIGQDIEFDFDVISKHRQEYKTILLKTIDRLETKKIRNQKRWYQVIRGYYILKHNSYDLTEEEKNIINIVHDQVEGWEQYKVTKKDILLS